MKIKLIVCLGIFLAYLNGSAQDVKEYNDITNKYTVASPDVYNFEKYSLNPINYYVGKPVISVPIYTIKTGGIEYPLNLVYDAGGVKVDQLASDVGLGWNLTSTILTRTVNQDNDFDNTGSLTLQTDYATYSQADKTADYNARTNYNTMGKVGHFLQKQLNTHIEELHKQVDFLPDIYHFYTNGFSTSFFFNDENTPVEINPKGTRIVAIKSKQRIDSKRYRYGIPEYNLLTQDFFTIIITTKEGIKYTFSDCDFAINQDLYVNGYVGGDNETIHPPSQISAWHITKIEDLKSDKKIDFIYTNTDSNPNQSNGVNKLLAQRNFEYISNPDYPVYPSKTLYPCDYFIGYDSENGYGTNYFLNETTRIDVQKKRLSKIKFDEGEITFNYGYDDVHSTGTVRYDVYNQQYLSEIYIKNKNLAVVKSFNLNYDYFASNYNVGEFNPDNTFNSYRYKRLKLKSIFEVGKPAYKFTYDESINLPPINSFAVDFLGYFNGSPDVSTVSIVNSSKPRPKLYHYPNRFERSLLPFPLVGINTTVIPGYFDRQTNDIYSKAWSLTKVEYPSGGSSEYKYESNQFEEFGQNIKGGGIRIAQQILNDGFGVPRTINYSYLKENSSITSGKLSSFPYFGFPAIKFFDVTIDYQQTPNLVTSPHPSLITDVIGWKLFGKSNLNSDITSGSYVGYSRVVETEIGNGRKEFKFTSNSTSDFQNKLIRLPYILSPALVDAKFKDNCLDDFIIANSGFASNIFTDNSYKRGMLLEEKTFSESQIVKIKTIDYLDNPISTYTFFQPSIRTKNGVQQDFNYYPFITARKDYIINQFLPKRETISSYDSLGNMNNESSIYTYNSNGILKTEEKTASNGNTKTNKYYYANDVVSTTSLNGDTLTLNEYNNYVAMSASTINNISEPIQIEKYTNSILNSIIRKTFKFFDTSNLVLPESVKTSKGNNSLFNDFTIDSYEIGTSNPSVITRNGSVKTLLIWGYNKSQIVAKIENAAYASIPPSLITDIEATSNTGTEASLLTALSNLRNDSSLANAMITTYTYIPLVGVSTITDPKGDKITYTYDSFGRLQNVKDKNGNILSENEYHYKN